MLELKFRAWNPYNKKMYCGVERAFHSNYGYWFEDVHGFGCLLDGKEIDYDYDKNKSEFVKCEIMQYIGIQDKNGKEVYEGDWIKTKTGYIDFVRWSDDYAGFFPFFVSDINESDFEIIGNIWENPELKREVV